MIYVCNTCGWEYNEDTKTLGPGIPKGSFVPGTSWKDLQDDFLCPLCGASNTNYLLKSVQLNAEIFILDEEVDCVAHWDSAVVIHRRSIG